MLNHFKFTGTLSKTAGKRHAGYAYNSLDFWLEQRTPAQMKVISSIAAPNVYLFKYFHGSHLAFITILPGFHHDPARLSSRSCPAFITILPGLKSVDLEPGQIYLRGGGPESYRHIATVNKDLESGLDMKWSAKTPLV
jgi:hypothetical protein